MPKRPQTVRPPGSNPKRRSNSSHYRRTRSYKGMASRLRVLGRDNFTCQSCGQLFSEEKLQADHIIPLEKGGADTDENKQTLCIECHRLKTERERNEFRFS